MEETNISDIADLTTFAETILNTLTEHEARGATVLALHGDLGAGKTTFTQTLARTLGVHETVTSPTFVIMKGYPLQNQPFTTLVHIDAYRIEEIDEMRVLGFETLLQEKSSIMCIEWAENIQELLPSDTLHIHFSLKGEDRSVTITHGN